MNSSSLENLDVEAINELVNRMLDGFDILMWTFIVVVFIFVLRFIITTWDS